ncbi:protein-tyrosine-phosphatase [Pseudonocardia asaccharolytica DSM 44247 = NBRC 16224]|uniref:protein-tyrosine-phosphatase n=2 Tax=Pseudonocardia asaccharolytica TaxID=54010 RepID=A0A511D552_9PSEU|nr:low molecular weight protein-tyrosine-phosphatase [Pseudonocardia asaccharolytica]GEL19922.1 protein-tyrosine-phosphatase [Pseudonocardia asaccharolytica DSM 44247 = NBRC 16224]
MNAPRERLSVAFVCTGNICRSPMAAQVFRAELTLVGLADQVTVISAGTGDWHIGNPADERAVALLRERGYPVDHVARQVDAAVLAADLLIALDDDHVRALRRSVAEPDRVRLLRSFDPDAPAGAEVPDPYYGGSEGFVEVLGMIEAAMPGLLDWVKSRL